MSYSVTWIKLSNGNWCNLETVNLSNVNTTGVYIIWNTSSEVVRIGQGNIAARLQSHRQDPTILRYKRNGLFGGITTRNY